MKSTTDQSVHLMFLKRANKYQFQKKKRDGKKSWKKIPLHGQLLSILRALRSTQCALTRTHPVIRSTRVYIHTGPKAAHVAPTTSTVAYSARSRPLSDRPRLFVQSWMHMYRTRTEDEIPFVPGNKQRSLRRVYASALACTMTMTTRCEIHGIACKLRILGILSANPSPSLGFRTLRLLRKLRRAICATMSGLLVCTDVCTACTCVRYSGTRACNHLENARTR